MLNVMAVYKNLELTIEINETKLHARGIPHLNDKIIET